jgi:RNA polymerase sigma factor (sigma-70 family)
LDSAARLDAPTIETTKNKKTKIETRRDNEWALRFMGKVAAQLPSPEEAAHACSFYNPRRPAGIEPFRLLRHTRRMPEAAGDSGAPLVDLRAWLDAHGNRLLRSAYLLCGNETEAQDLVQETLLQAWKSAHRFRGDSAVYTWLHGILLNLSRHHWRKQKRFVFDERIALQIPCDVAPESDLDQEYQAARLTRAIQTLSPEHREVIVLRYYDDLKLQQIAERTGASLGTVKSRLHYALRCLEKLVPDELNLFATEGTHPQTSP